MGEVRVVSRGQETVSVAFQGDRSSGSFGPKVTALGVSVVSRVANTKHDKLCPAVSKEL